MSHPTRRHFGALALVPLVVAFLLPLGCASAEDDMKIAAEPAEPAEPANPVDKKFDFSLADLGTGTRPNSAGAMRPIGYEYCIPKMPEAIVMVGNTDPTGMVHTNRATTIQCSEDELPASGNTGQPDYLVVMRKIAGHDFIEKIILVEIP